MSGVRRIELGYNNVYLVEAEAGSVLIDTGPDYRGAWEALAEGLGSLPPRLVVATHGHGDHAGLGHAWQAAGVAVALGEADLQMAREPGLGRGECARMAGWVRASGAPPEVVAPAVAALERRRAGGAAAQRPALPAVHGSEAAG